MTALWSRSSSLAVVESETRVVVLNLDRLDTGSTVALEGTAFAIWLHLDEAVSTARLVDLLADASGAAPNEIGPVVEGFLAQLQTMGIVERNGSDVTIESGGDD